MYILFIFLILLSISLIFIQSKYFFLVDRPENQQHKLTYNKNIPLSGGIYFFIAILTNTLLTEYYDQNFLIIIFLFLFLILGIYSDLIINFSPRIRLLYQITLVILIIIFLDLKMDVYLHIAEVQINVILILFKSFVIGFLSGLFGVGGGFLMTPFLIFMGIPPAYAVANEAK